MRYVALLRGINVSGQKLIKMEQLRQLFTDNNCNNVVSYIQSGNIIFDSLLPTPELQIHIERFLKTSLGYDVHAIVRTIDELKQVANTMHQHVPLLKDGEKFYVYFLSDVPASDCLPAALKYLGDTERVLVSEKEIYFWSMAFGNSKFTNTVLEKKLNVMATARNYNTVLKISTL